MVIDLASIGIEHKQGVPREHDSVWQALLGLSREDESTESLANLRQLLSNRDPVSSFITRLIPEGAEIYKKNFEEMRAILKAAQKFGLSTEDSRELQKKAAERVFHLEVDSGNPDSQKNVRSFIARLYDVGIDDKDIQKEEVLRWLAVKVPPSKEKGVQELDFVSENLGLPLDTLKKQMYIKIYTLLEERVFGFLDDEGVAFTRLFGALHGYQIPLESRVLHDSLLEQRKQWKSLSDFEFSKRVNRCVRLAKEKLKSQQYSTIQLSKFGTYFRKHFNRPQKKK